MGNWRKTVFVWLALFCLAQMAPAQETGKATYWVGFSNKAGTPFFISQPHQFLSERALQRRERMQIGIDSLDLPVSPIYTDSLKSIGATILHTSKWGNGATIRSADPEIAQKLKNISFIREVQLTKPAEMLKSARLKWESTNFPATIDTSFYGHASLQVGMLNGQHLHNSGFWGSGIHIAVLDAGFKLANQTSSLIALWQNGQILGTRDFVDPASNFFEQHEHGTNVLSVLAANLPGSLMGTAPGASYYLFRSEDDASEYLVEEDNWAAAAEYADSLGVDIITSSLGYFQFDDPEMNHPYSEMDGKTTRVTRAANIAFAKGILVVASAGNEANNSWKYIVAPSDGTGVVSIGAVDENGVRAPFSSFGPAYGGAIKPNVAALGWRTAIQKANNLFVNANGTSFSAPLVAGMAACLWQARPHATNAEIKKAIEESASRFATPDDMIGFGIPDFRLAAQLLLKPEDETLRQSNWLAYPNPFSENLYLYSQTDCTSKKIETRFVRPDGQVALIKKTGGSHHFNLDNLSNLPNGLWLLVITDGQRSSTIKVVKNGQ